MSLGEMEEKINANPTKKFFISMLTRDIDIEPAIVELVDNSLDGAKRFRSSATNQFQVKIMFDKDQFSISDTCGGISIQEARDYCFRFGRSDGTEGEDTYKDAEGVGVFGIGMKRALFRLGKRFYIKSVTKTEHFVINVDVDEWLKDTGPDWNFKFEETQRGENNEDTECGTQIIVTNLYTSISNSFMNPYFKNKFMEYLRRRSTKLKELLTVMTVNGDSIEYIDEKIIYTNEFKPKVRNIDIDNVHIKIIAACAQMGNLKKSGWYIFCNGRMILYADQSETTGWGTDSVPIHHPSHAAFRGYVFFQSNDLEKLPWNTTKTGIDMSSKYYRAALLEMKNATKEFIEFRNGLDDIINSNEGLTIEGIFNCPEISIFDTKVVSMTEEDYLYVFPRNFPIPGKPMTTVSYKIEKQRAEKAKTYFCANNNMKMGLMTFEYFYEREIEEDE